MWTIDEEFKIFLEDVRDGRCTNLLEVQPHIWNSKAWELIDKKTTHELLLPFIKSQILRAQKTMPLIYKNSYEQKGISVEKMDTIDEFWNVPALVKDSNISELGIRKKVKDNPYVLLPNDIKKSVFVYKSGGTRGVPTPTFITAKDREIESWAFARGFQYEGMKAGDVALTTYNPTHKGGEEIKEGFERAGMTVVLKRTTDTAKDVIKTIEDYNVSILLTVQGPLHEGDIQDKGPGVDLMKLIEAGQDVIEKRIKILFLGGYRLIPEAIAWAKVHNIPLVTLLGSSEAIPQATNTNFGPPNRLCIENNLHVLNGPHYIEVLKEESGVLVPTKKGEDGILAYTTVAREGTIYIRYLPGDSARIAYNQRECSCGLTSEIITDIGRMDIPEDVVQTGCCIG